MPRFDQTVVMLTPHGDPLGRIGEPDIGGQCVYVRELSAHLAKTGWRVVALTRDRCDGRPKRESIAPGADVVRIRCGPPGFIPKEQLPPYLEEFASNARLALPPSRLFHSHYWDGAYVASRLRTREHWIHTSHSVGKLKQAAVPEDIHGSYKERIEIESKAYQHCDAITALTERERANIVSLYGIDMDKIQVVPPGVNTERFRPVISKPNLRYALDLPDAPTVFSLGRLDPRKGFDLLFEAIGLLWQERAIERLSLVFSAGAGAPEEEAEADRLKQIIERQGFSDWLTWLPVLDQEKIPSYYAAADVFVLPSRYEPFGIVMLEAMASEVPPIATMHGGPARVISDGVDGRLIDPNDVRSTSRVIVSLLADDSRRISMGKAARSKVVSSYGWDVIAARNATIYMEGPNAR